MEDLERQEHLQAVTKRLVSFTGLILLILAIGLYGLHDDKRSYLVTLVFASGLLGGFVSIQQRLPKIKLQELKTLSTSWVSITLIPINGGIFALVLMLMFIGNIIQGELFPEYPNKFNISNANDFYQWISLTYPKTGEDIAKLFFWSFVAGFSERFVPQIIRKTSENKTQATQRAQDIAAWNKRGEGLMFLEYTHAFSVPYLAGLVQSIFSVSKALGW